LALTFSLPVNPWFFIAFFFVLSGLLDSPFLPLFVGMAVSLTAILLGLALERGLKVRGGPK
jgi:hypothetical protein